MQDVYLDNLKKFWQHARVPFFIISIIYKYILVRVWGKTPNWKLIHFRYNENGVCVMSHYFKRPMLSSSIKSWNHFIESKLKFSKLYKNILLIRAYLICTWQKILKIREDKRFHKQYSWERLNGHSDRVWNYYPSLNTISI